MSSPASIAGHPIHPMLITVPIGLWVFSLVSDIIFFTGWGGATWGDVAFYTMGGGIVGALLAALPGLVDLVSLKDARTKRVGLIHMTINLCLVAAYAVNWWLRYTGPRETTAVFGLSIVSVIALAVSGWLGGEMVYKYGVSVDPQHDSPEQERAKIRRAA
jgi:uncharacterized membrane protein